MTIAEKSKHIPADKILYNSNNINICYASERNYAKYLSLSMATVLNSKNPEDKINFYILDGGLTEKDRQNILYLKKYKDCEIKFINVESEVFANCPLGNTRYLTIVSYYRLLIADFLPCINKVIYLDCDVQVKGSLKELFYTDLCGNALGAAHDINNEKISKHFGLEEYFNAGVLLMDLNKLRETEFTSKVFDWINDHSEELLYHDQDVINLYFKNSITNIGEKWNTQFLYHLRSFETITKNALIVHYIAKDKGRFIYNTFPLIFKTKYKYNLFQIWIKNRSKTFIQWIFMLRKKDENTKNITLFGFRFDVKWKDRKNKEA